jgi:choice-of-anchor A domain-containing protein
MNSSARSLMRMPALILVVSLLATGCSADTDGGTSQETVGGPYGTAAAMCNNASSGVRFFLTPGQAPSGDLDWQAHVSGFTEFDFENIAPGTFIDSLNAGPITVDLGLEGINGTAPMVGTYWSYAFPEPGVFFGNSLLNEWNQRHSRISFTFSEPVEGFGTWVFDDTSAIQQSFRMIVTDASGSVSVSPILESGNGFSHAIEGFIGVTSAVGITKVSIENLEEQQQCRRPGVSYFELDHVQIGNRRTSTNPGSDDVCPPSSSSPAVLTAGQRDMGRDALDESSTNMECIGCIAVHLSDYNLFLLEDYSGGHDVQGKVAAGGNVSMTNFAVGTGLPDSDIRYTLVAGGNLTLYRGGVWGDAWHGGSYTTDPSVVFPWGSLSQGSPIDFATRGAELRTLSTDLAALATNGTTTIEPWGGVMLRGMDPAVNIFQVNASDLSNAVLLSIDAPVGSLAVLNISGTTATLQGGHSFSGGIDQRGVLFNFVDATAISASGYGLWGTMLAPYAHVSFSNGSFDGGIYARSMTGDAEGHINSLQDRDICGDSAVTSRIYKGTGTPLHNSLP